MKLVLANNHTERFENFYTELAKQAPGLFSYAAYETLLFCFDSDAAETTRVTDVRTGTNLTDYDGVYLNGYLDTYELAAALATCCGALHIPFANRELADAPSLSKLTAYAKLAAAGVRVPKTLAGTKTALLEAGDALQELHFPLVLKRADADRGIDNYKIAGTAEIAELLQDHDARSIWICQEYVENDGFYLVSFYGQTPEFCIFRTLQARPDGDGRKAHMYKPKGGANARLIELTDVPPPVLQACQAAMDATNRQIGSVDCLYDPATEKPYVLEVNYNPQLVTIETFKETRIRAFLDGIGRIG